MIVVQRATGRTIRRFVATLIAAAPRESALAAVVMLLASVVEGVGLVLLVPLLQLAGVDAGTGADQRIGTALSSTFAWFGATPTLGSVLAVYVGVVVCQSVLFRVQVLLSGAVRQQTEATLRLRLYRAIGRAQWLFIARHRTSELAHVLTAEIDRIGTAAHDLVDLLVVSLVVLVYTAIAFRLSPEMTGLVMGCAALLAWVLRRRVADSDAIGGELITTRARLHSAITEHLASLKTAKSYGALDRQYAELEGLTHDMRRANLNTVAGYARLRQLTMVGAAVALAATVYVARGILALSTAQLLVLLFVFARLMPRLTGLIERAQLFATLLPSFAAFDALEARCARAAEPPVAKRTPIRFTDQVSFDNVSFAYGDADGPAAVCDLGLTIRAGHTTAIVGPSGAGKSTAADLLLGLIEPARGVIAVDAQPLTADRLPAWRDQIGYVNQDTFLFHDTIRANLLWARPDATQDDLGRVLRLAAADDFVAGLPKGLETVIGDRGVLVSGGERQRLALARALLRQPALLVLDEATNALDTENETRIQQAVDRLRHEMTILVITHRLGTVRHADTIHVLDGGRLVESGSWDELAARRGGRFRRLLDAQPLEQRPVWVEPPAYDRVVH